jgi:hypothetical protein
MGLFSDVLFWPCRILLGALTAVVAHQLITGRINTKGLFHGRRGDGSQYFSPERVQLLMITLAGAARYLSLVMAHPACAPGQTCSLPDFPTEWLQMVGGSHAVYLTRKAYSMNFGAGPDRRPKQRQEA